MNAVYLVERCDNNLVAFPDRASVVLALRTKAEGFHDLPRSILLLVMDGVTTPVEVSLRELRLEAAGPPPGIASLDTVE